jgi:hypothetical protein
MIKTERGDRSERFGGSVRTALVAALDHTRESSVMTADRFMPDTLQKPGDAYPRRQSMIVFGSGEGH